MPCIKIWLRKKPTYLPHPQNWEQLTPTNTHQQLKWRENTPLCLLVSGRKDWREVTSLRNPKFARGLYCYDDFEWPAKAHRSAQPRAWCCRECDTSQPACGHTLQPAAPVLTQQVSRPGLPCAQHTFPFLIKPKTAFSFVDLPAAFSFPHS